MSHVAWYARPGGRLRSWNNLFHWPYSIWMLSYVVMGAGLVEKSELHWDRLGISLIVFFLGLQAGHFLDEVMGHPLKTGIPDWQLKLASVLCFVLAWAIGVPLGARWVGLWPIVSWAALLTMLVVFYNLGVEYFHSDVGFAFTWGFMPVLFGYWLQTIRMPQEAVLIAAACLFLSLAQRSLSFRARFIRRKMENVEESYKKWLLQPLERSLKLLNAMVIILAVGLLLS